MPSDDTPAPTLFVHGPLRAVFARPALPFLFMSGARRSRMTRDGFNAFCGSLPATTHVVQWGDAEVWKVGGKVFAIGGWNGEELRGVTFKTSDIAYEILKDQPGLRPAPYLASRGMKWIQHYAEPGLADEELRHYLRDSHRLVALGLSKKRQRELGLIPPADPGAGAGR